MYVSELSSFYLGTILQSLRPWIWRMRANISSLSSWKSRFNFSKLLFNNLGSGGWKCPWSGGINDTAQSRAKHDSAQWALIGQSGLSHLCLSHPSAPYWVGHRKGRRLGTAVGPVPLYWHCQFSFQVPLLQTGTLWCWLSSAGRQCADFLSSAFALGHDWW